MNKEELLKDFWYLYFMVEVGADKKYFLNYNHARRYYHSLKGVSKSYYGRHLFNGLQCFHLSATLSAAKGE